MSSTTRSQEERGISQSLLTVASHHRHSRHQARYQWIALLFWTCVLSVEAAAAAASSTNNMMMNQAMTQMLHHRHRLEEDQPRSLYHSTALYERLGIDNSSSYTSPFRNMRIRFWTGGLDASVNAETSVKVEYLKRDILPRLARLWNQALSVIPVQGSLVLNRELLHNRKYCGTIEFSEVPEDHWTNGLFDTDLILYISGSVDSSTRNNSTYCTGWNPAVGIPCNYDIFDRPTAGALHICLDQITMEVDGATKPATDQQLLYYLHQEMAHILGFSSTHLRFFWDRKTGMPRTPRPFEPTTVTCVDGTQKTLLVPAANTLQFFSMDDNSVTVQNAGAIAAFQRYAAIVTPTVQTIVRNQFNCPSLHGARLENQDWTAPSSGGMDFCFGEQWESRDYFFDVTTIITNDDDDDSIFLNPLTLALLEDSGWYQANYTYSSKSTFGLGAGCNFVQKPCLGRPEQEDTNDGGPNDSHDRLPIRSKGYFCNTSGSRGCSPSLTHKMACTVVDYSDVVTDGEELLLPPEPFQYFSSPTLGGPWRLDYCPVYSATYGSLEAEKLDCTNPRNSPSMYDINIFSEDFGPESKCIEGSGLGNVGESPKCYSTACVQSERKLKINVNGEWFTCQFDFEAIELRVAGFFNGPKSHTIQCPRFAQACPHLVCPHLCSGKGTCHGDNSNASYAAESASKCTCFDPRDQSPGCIRSVAEFRPLQVPNNNDITTPPTPPTNATDVNDDANDGDVDDNTDGSPLDITQPSGGVQTQRVPQIFCFLWTLSLLLW